MYITGVGGEKIDAQSVQKNAWLRDNKSRALESIELVS